MASQICVNQISDCCYSGQQKTNLMNEALYVYIYPVVEEPMGHWGIAPPPPQKKLQHAHCALPSQKFFTHVAICMQYVENNEKHSL